MSQLRLSKEGNGINCTHSRNQSMLEFRNLRFKVIRPTINKQLYWILNILYVEKSSNKKNRNSRPKLTHSIISNINSDFEISNLSVVDSLIKNCAKYWRSEKCSSFIGHLDIEFLALQHQRFAFADKNSKFKSSSSYQFKFLFSKDGEFTLIHFFRL